MDPKWTEGNELEYLKQVLQNSSEVRKNPFTDRLEKAFAEKYGVKYAIGSEFRCILFAFRTCGSRCKTWR